MNSMVSAHANGTATAQELPQLRRLDALLEDWEREAAAAHEAYTTGKARGPITGLPTLDRELGAMLAPGLHVAHGSPGVGKTAFALQLAVSCGCPALVVSCEMGRLELFRRITARLTATFLGRLKSGEFPPEESLALARQAARAAPLVALADATQAFASPAWILDAAKGTRGDAEHLLIVVDSAHSWAEGWLGDESEYDGLNAALAALRKLAAELHCPILAIAERNRASMSIGGQSASAGSRKFEYGAESVLDLNREKDTPPDLSGEVPVSLTIAKNRNGSPGKKVQLKFHGALQRFREADK